MTKPTAKLQQILREHSYSVTKQRQLVFGLLLDQEPLSMHHLVERARGQLDRASVYRTVAIFEKIGVAQRVNLGWKYKIELSDKFTEHHHHLSCQRCQAVLPISGQELEAFINRLAADHHFEVTDHQIELQGFCQRCRS